jgi:PAS domain S-box-containing protein
MFKTSLPAEELRRQAELRLERLQKSRNAPLVIDSARLVHELQVHQIELELQNEELQKSYLEATVLRDRYQDLYDFAPVGYVTVDLAGELVELNLCGAVLLGLDREALLGRNLRDFMRPDFVAMFAEFLARTNEATEETSATLVLYREGEAIYVKAQGRPFVLPDSGGHCIRIVLMNLTELHKANDELRRTFEKFFAYWRP